MNVAFSDDGWNEYLALIKNDLKGFHSLNKLIEECRRNPFKGTGKPEPLKQNLKGWWSRRLNQKDRIVYRVTGKPPEQTLEIIQCTSHY